MAKRVLKFNDAFESYLNHLIRDCNINHNELKNPDCIKNLAQTLELTIKELFTTSEVFKNRLDYCKAVKESLDNRFFYQPPVYSIDDLDYIDKKLFVIDSHPKHAQRSPEWYHFRWERLTASDLGKAVGDKGDKSRLELIYQKSMSLEQYIKQREGTSLSGPAIQHGICFEAVATELYEIKNNLTVLEYGCLPHQYVDYLAASPDGICKSRESNPNYHGRMLEIKCPYSRVITGIPKTEYYMQVQLQLEVCDLEYCDFLECDIRVYSGMTQFLNDSPKDEASYKYTKSNKPKGVIYEYYEKGSNSTKYKYCPLKLSNDEICQWIQDTREEIINDSRYHSGGCKYWWLEEFNENLIKREPEYFANLKIKLDEFWEKVVHYRKNGVLELEYKLGIKQKPASSLDNHLERKSDIEIDMDYLKPGDIDTIDFIDVSEQKPSKNTYNDIDFIDTTKEEPPVKSKSKSLLVIKPDSDDDNNDDL